MVEKQEDLTKKGFFKLSWMDRIGYGSGDLAQNLIYQTISVWLLFFYTNVFGLDPAAAATMFLVVRIVDVLWDPVVGTFIDKHNTRWGKYRSYLILGGIPLTAFSILCFFNGFTGSLAYAYFTYVAMSMCYTLVNVPYCALNSALTRDPDEITTLTNTRMWMSNIGAFAVSGGIPIVASIFAPDGIINNPAAASAWFITMSIFAIVGFLLLVFCFSKTKEKVVMEESGADKVKIADLWREFLHNKPLRIVAIFFLVAFSISSISNAAGSYYMTYNMGATADQISIFMALAFIPALICLPLIGPMKKRIGKKGVFYFLILTAIAGMIMLYVISAVPQFKGNVYLAYVAQFIKSFGITSIVGGYMWALVPDVVAYGEFRTGKRTAGMATAITGIFFKAGVALGGAVPGFVLAFVGFDASITTQTPFAEQGILWLICIIPCCLLVVALIIISRYQLTDSFMFELNEKIQVLNSLIKYDPEKAKIARAKKKAALEQLEIQSQKEIVDINADIEKQLLDLVEQELKITKDYEVKVNEIRIKQKELKDQLNKRVTAIRESADEIKREVEKKSRLQENRIFGAQIDSDSKNEDSEKE